METLFLTRRGFTGELWQLTDSHDAYIGCGTKATMISWAKENGYRVQIREGNTITWA